MERRKFTREFKLEAVRLIKERGGSYVQVQQSKTMATRETLAQHHARWPRRISLRDRVQCDRAYVAIRGLHTFVRTQQLRRGCEQ
jgi:hypothetical protein